MVSAVPQLIALPADIEVLDTMLVTVFCTAAELWTSAQLQWSVRGCNVPSNNLGGCQLTDESPYNATTIRAMFTASLDWDQATLVCSAATPVSQESLVPVLFRGAEMQQLRRACAGLLPAAPCVLQLIKLPCRHVARGRLADE